MSRLTLVSISFSSSYRNPLRLVLKILGSFYMSETQVLSTFNSLLQFWAQWVWELDGNLIFIEKKVGM